MSGQKEFVARLSAEAEAKLAADLQHCRENAAELASTANLAGQATSMASTVRAWLDRGSGNASFRAKLEAMVAASSQLNDVRAEIQRTLDGAVGTGGRVTTPAEAARISRVRDETTSRLRSVGSLRDQVSTLLAQAERGLAAESKMDADRKLFEGAQRRAQVAGLLDELDMRMHPAAGSTLAGIGREVSGLHKSLAALRDRKDHPSREELEKARGELAVLVTKAEQQEQESRRQWSVFERLDKAFQGVDFHRDGRVELPAPGKSVRASHSTRESDVVATIRSEVDADGSIHIEMRGGGETGAITLPPDDHCPDRLLNIAMKARDLGLVIEKVLFKGPDGYQEMPIPGFIDTEDPGIGKSNAHVLEAGR